MELNKVSFFLRGYLGWSFYVAYKEKFDFFFLLFLFCLLPLEDYQLSSFLLKLGFNLLSLLLQKLSLISLKLL